MCGIFAYMGHKPLTILGALEVLRVLESQQEPDEKLKGPVGEHGAGIAYLNQEGKFTLTKVGKTNTNSPVNNLQLQLKETANNSSCLILGHVRRAHPKFVDTVSCKECTQPYQPNCLHNPDSTVLTAHNGYLQKYQQLKNTLTKPHQFESQKHTLIDSEVIAHLAEEHLNKTKNPTKTTHTLIEQVKGNNTIAIAYIDQHEAYLHAVQKGKTRGLVAWTNQNGETLICTREGPVEQVLSQFLTQSNYQKIIRITHRDSTNITAHFNVELPAATHQKRTHP